MCWSMYMTRDGIHSFGELCLELLRYNRIFSPDIIWPGSIVPVPFDLMLRSSERGLYS